MCLYLYLFLSIFVLVFWSYLCWHFNTHLTGDFCPSLVCPGLGLCFQKQLVASHRSIVLLLFSLFFCRVYSNFWAHLLLSWHMTSLFGCNHDQDVMYLHSKERHNAMCFGAQSWTRCQWSKMQLHWICTLHTGSGSSM